MDHFRKAKVVRLRSRHDKYLMADDDESVTQDRNGASRQAKWEVEFVNGDANAIRLKSCFGCYLTASNKPDALRLTGLKVVQSLPARLDSSVEWLPVKDGEHVKLKTRYGNFLRANKGTYPYKNSVTHDVPHRTLTQDWVLWDVDVVEVLPTTKDYHVHDSDSPPVQPPYVPSPAPPRPREKDSSRFTSSASIVETPSSPAPPALPKPKGRIIHYYIADDDGNVVGTNEPFSILFEGSSVEELTQRLEEETDMDGVIVCTRNVLNEQLYPIRLRLPPSNAEMNVVVVPASSELVASLASSGLI